MMRLPHFRYAAPSSLEEAVDLLAARPGETMVLAGGTDLLPNMKRRQQVPRTLVGLRGIASLRNVRNGDGLALGAGLTLTEVLRDTRVRDGYLGLWQAASQVATPHLRNMGTLGGNLCLDTRCNYYDQNYEWRKAIDFCMKKDGEICWVAPSSQRCLAVSSTDTAPALISLGARVSLRSAGGERVVDLADLYRNDGIEYLTRRPDEILTEVRLGSPAGLRSTYWKLRRRGSFDFPVLSVAASVRLGADGSVAEARIVLGSVSSKPVLASAASGHLAGKPLSDGAIAQAADLASEPSRPMDNTDFTLHWRKRVTREFVTYALRELRGDDVRALRLRVSRQAV
jgi:4-hydroxybenzoyl-CoA reductase subunit beta